jgi:hypothetical protein
MSVAAYAPLPCFAGAPPASQGEILLRILLCLWGRGPTVRAFPAKENRG